MTTDDYCVILISKEGRTMARSELDAVLARVPLFAGLSKKDLRQVSSLTTGLQLAEGTELTHQGSQGREFLVVLDGTVDVIIDGKMVATCGAGDFFGEIALLEGGARTATVVAKTDVFVEVINKAEFSTLLNSHPQILDKIRAVETQRVEDNTAGNQQV
jgi:CRP/FNR family cyclic AMP-dependent transcriptional regulator